MIAGAVVLVFGLAASIFVAFRDAQEPSYPRQEAVVDATYDDPYERTGTDEDPGSVENRPHARSKSEHGGIPFFLTAIGIVWCVVRATIRLRVEAQGVSTSAEVVDVSVLGSGSVLTVEYEVGDKRYRDRVTSDGGRAMGDLVEVMVIPSEPHSCELVRD